MIDRHLFDQLVLIWIGIAAVVFVVLFFITAPYGRHGEDAKGPKFPGRIAWLLMEAPSPVIMALCFITGTHQHDVAAWCFLALWEAHYVHRAFIFPLRLSGVPKPMPFWITLSGASFNLVNATMNGQQLFVFSNTYGAAWLLDPRFIAGVMLFFVGYGVNLHADTVLLRLRRPGETGYKIPQGGLYRLISCPNYLGEMAEWSGFALATWSLPALTFAVWTIANLFPRAIANHRWYRTKFSDYPPGRKALIPFVV